MIGGYVLDTSAVLAWSRRTSIMVDALAWSAVADTLVLAVPATVAGAARSQLSDSDDLAVLDVLVGLDVTVVPPFRLTEALTVSAGDQLDHAHTVGCARDRGWSVVTATPERYTGSGVELIDL